MNTNAVHHASKAFQCQLCPKSFLLRQSLEHHILNQHGKDKLKIKPLHCSQCLTNKKVATYYSKRHLLNAHIREAHGQRRCKCDICFKTFAFPSRLRTHQRIHSTKLKKYKCDLCSKVFSLNRSLQDHLFYVHNQKCEGVKYLKCDCCAQEFTQISQLEKHVVAKHVVDKEFKCDICAKRFIDQKVLEKHVEGHDKKIQYFCDVCSKGFKYKQSLTHHIETQHATFLSCGQCLKCFADKTEYDEHINLESTLKLELQFKCPSCSQILPSQCALNVHIHFHSKTKIIKSEKVTEEQPKQELKCEHCSKIFEQEATFAAHRNYVHRNAKWTCNFEKCTKSYRRYNQLRDHKMTHSNLRAYACPTCPKSFKLLEKLKMHQRTHLDEKPFKCDMCPKSFVRGWTRKLHIANKHGGRKPFKCFIPNCGMTFPTITYLKVHSISHESKRLFKCDFCIETKEFKSLVSLRQHHRFVHSGDKSSKRFNQVVFTCTSEECSSFKTGSEKEVAVHYNEQHGLPKVELFQNSIIKIENIPLGSVLSFSEEIPNVEAKRLILKQYKCKFCLKLFSFSLFKKHPEKCSAKSVFKCTRCSKSFQYKNNLAKHVRDQHSV